MAKCVTIKFDNDKEADAFVDYLNDAEAIHIDRSEFAIVKAEVVDVFKRIVDLFEDRKEASDGKAAQSTIPDSADR